MTDKPTFTLTGGQDPLSFTCAFCGRSPAVNPARVWNPGKHIHEDARICDGCKVGRKWYPVEDKPIPIAGPGAPPSLYALEAVVKSCSSGLLGAIEQLRKLQGEDELPPIDWAPHPAENPPIEVGENDHCPFISEREDDWLCGFDGERCGGRPSSRGEYHLSDEPCPLRSGPVLVRLKP